MHDSRPSETFSAVNKVERLADDTDTYRLQYVTSVWWMIILFSYIGVSKKKGYPKMDDL